MNVTAISHVAHEVAQNTEVSTGEISGVGKLAASVARTEAGGLAKEVSKVADNPVQGAIDHWREQVKNVKIEPLSFRGFRNAALVADRQVGPTCGYEALENAIQIMIDDRIGKNNDLSTVMQKMVSRNPFDWGAGRLVYQGKSYFGLPFDKYPKMLGAFKIDSCRSHFSHEKLQHALSENRPVIICGDVGYLPQQYYDQKGMHAVVVTDWDKQNGLYTIVDSNFPKESYQLDSQTLEKFVNGSLPEELKNSEYGNMVVINSRAAWVNDAGRVSFGGGLDWTQVKEMNGRDKIARGNRKISEGKVSIGRDLIREGERDIEEARRARKKR